MSPIHLVLRAIKPETNINRVYEIRIDKGLFNSWLVLIGYGRYGEGSCQKIYSFFNAREAKTFVQKNLKKRFQSHKRIGCYYKIVKTSGFEDIMPIS
jgi:hypothetical protein